MSPFEICPKGNYCPDPSQVIPCPSGSYCKAGWAAPRPCSKFSRCPAGSSAPGVLQVGTCAMEGGCQNPVHALIGCAHDNCPCHLAHRMRSSVSFSSSSSCSWSTLPSMLWSGQGRDRSTPSGTRGSAWPLLWLPFLGRNTTGSAWQMILQQMLLIERTNMKNIIVILSSRASHIKLFANIEPRITIRFKGLGLELKDGTSVLSGVTGEFRHSRLFAVMGPSGAGKVSSISRGEFKFSWT